MGPNAYIMFNTNDAIIDKQIYLRMIKMEMSLANLSIKYKYVFLKSFMFLFYY